MPSVTIGDLSQHLLTTRNNTTLKTDLNTLVSELTSGEKSDLTAHLGASQTNLAGLDRQLEMLGRFERSNNDTQQMLSTMQLALGGVDSQRSRASGALLNITQASNASDISNTGSIAQSAFEGAVQSLNTRFGDRALFGGNDVNEMPLAEASLMLDALSLATAGLTDVAGITAAVDDWFNLPGGGFETVGYQGDTTGVMSRSIDGSQNIDVDVRADDQAVRDTLKHLALGALAGDMSDPLDLDTRRTLQQTAGESLLTSASSFFGMQARLGYAEGRVEEASVRISAQQTSYGIARNELVSADPFETATRLQAVQLQLETQFALTARLSRLSLTEYLR